MTISNIQTVPAGDVMLKLGDRLLELLSEERAVIAKPMADVFPNWTPHPAECHDNADAWLARRPADEVVRGWMYQRMDRLPEGDVHVFVAHSVIRTAAGELIDVTLPRLAPAGRFLRHPREICGFFAVLLSPLAPKEFKVLEPRARPGSTQS